MLRKYQNGDVAEGRFDPLTMVESSEHEPQEGLPAVAVRERAFVPTELLLLFRIAGMSVRRHTPNDFDYMGVRINGTRAQGRRMVSNWIFTDSHQRFVLNLENGALTHVANTQSAQANLTLTLTRVTLAAVLLGEQTFGQAAQAGAITVGGDAAGLEELAGLMDNFEAMFEIVAPKRKAP